AICIVVFAAEIAPYLAGCAVVKPIAVSTDAVMSLQGYALTIVTYNPKAGFIQETWGNAAFEGINPVAGAIVTISEGKDLMKKYDLVNPSVEVAEKMEPLLIGKFRPATVNLVADNSEGGKNLAALAALAGKKGLVFDVQGSSVSIYYPLNW